MPPLPASSFRSYYTALVRKQHCVAAASTTCKTLKLRNRCNGSTPRGSCPTDPSDPVPRYLAPQRAAASASRKCNLTTAHAVGPGPRESPQEDRTAAAGRDSGLPVREAGSGRQQEQPPQPQGPMPTAMDGLNWWVTRRVATCAQATLVACQGPETPCCAGPWRDAWAVWPWPCGQATLAKLQGVPGAMP